jgi:hypothetical protein
VDGSVCAEDIKGLFPQWRVERESYCEGKLLMHVSDRKEVH